MKLSIGQLLVKVGENVKTLRYWTDLELLEAERSENGYRYFNEKMIERVAFIRHAQALGFSLSDIRSIVSLRETGVPPCDQVRWDLRHQLEGVQTRIKELKRLERELIQRLHWAEANPSPDCSTEGCVYLNATVTNSLDSPAKGRV
jgi:DNA-binding transcriptional MerR regulator